MTRIWAPLGAITASTLAWTQAAAQPLSNAAAQSSDWPLALAGLAVLAAVVARRLR